MNGLLFCNGCSRDLPVTEYHKKNGTRLGLAHRCKDCSRDIQWKIKYGITRTDYFTMLERQGRVCAICGGPELIYDHFMVDHHHKTGKVRALLCSHCNKLLGCAREDINVLNAAIKYLEGYK